MQKTVKWLAGLTFIGMFLVLLMGAVVTNTGAGRGCGEDWPLCNGRFVPAYTIESLIEYSHRLVSGFVGIIVLATTIAVFWKLRHRRDAKIYIALAFFFTFVQAIMGALAVKNPQSSGVLALHFGFSLLAFAFTLLLALSIRDEEQRIRRENFKGTGSGDESVATPFRFRFLAWFATFYSYIVVYLGAYVKHTKSAGGCEGWPLCSGEVIPSDLSGATGIVFAHRLAAIVLWIIVAYLAFQARSLGPSMRQAGIWTLVLASLQIASGALLVYSVQYEWYLFSILLHITLVAGLFSMLAYIAIGSSMAARQGRLRGKTT